ncbi:MAG TPA: SRPBCC family protein [Candidatus Binatia bacterium]|jgi:hypothetical protein|nr:SRPBCC family protein [Candidatus Binatia bacterium]
MLKKLAIVVVVLVLGFLGYAATRPDTVHVERATTIAAPPEKIFPHIADLHQWVDWSPWEKVDPAMQRTYSGAASGPGAVYEWSGDANVGKGRMEIVKTTPSSDVVIDLHFIEPFEGRNTAEFTLRPAGAATNVTWTMRGPNTFLGKVIGVFIDMDDMIGSQFATGLADLKALAEKQ